MRLKGINPFEQHVEKIVAGLFALVLLAVLALQFLTADPTVKVGNQDRTLTTAYEPIKSEAARVKKQLEAPDPADMPPGPESVVKNFANFDAALHAPVAPAPTLAAALDVPVHFGPGSKDIPNATSPIAELTVPAPTHVMGAPFLATISTSEQSDPAVAQILPAANPLDKAAVTVEGAFDGTALKTALMNDPDGNGPMRAIPKNWWDAGVQILAVELRRQTLKPDGTWTAEEPVKPMPGRPLLLDQVDALNDAVKLHDAVKFAGEQAEMVRRTPYYLTSFGEHWAAPSERTVAEVDKSALIARKKDELRREEATLKRHQDDRAKIGQAPAPGGAQPPPGGGGRGGGGRGGGGGAAPPPTTTGPSNADEQRRKSLDNVIAKDQERIAKVKQELRDLGETVEGDQNMAPEPPKPAAKGEPPLLDNPSIRLWAHDVFVERGKTYRYQMRIVLTNPYFGHSAAMVPAQAEKLAKSGVIRSAASEWTAPITVDPDQYTFFTSATEDDVAIGRTASARAEIYQFKWGFWRRGSKELEPGDLVVAEIKMPDFSKFLAAAPGDQPPGQPAATPPPPPPGPGRSGRIPGQAPSPTPTPGPGGAEPLAPGTTVPTTNVEVKTGQMMLAVGTGPARDPSGKGSKMVSQVFVREADEQVSVVVPDMQKQDPAYTRVYRNAERGIKEMTPPPPEKPKTNMPGPRPTRPGDEPAPIRPPAPGGGG